MTDRHPQGLESLAARAWQAFAGGDAARAWQAFAGGDAARARTLAAAATAARPAARRDRQRAQIVTLAISGEADRAGGLAAEHLAEFPGDQLIRCIREWTARRETGA